MTEDKFIDEPDLHLSPETIANLSHKLANHYRREVQVKGMVTTTWGDEYRVIFRPGAYEVSGKRKVWTDEAAGTHLTAQVNGLRSALDNARVLEEKYEQKQIEQLTSPLTNGITFEDIYTRAFLEDILIRRIMVEDSKKPEVSYALYSEQEARKMRDELWLKDGMCNMTLEEAITAALVGPLKLTRS